MLITIVGRGHSGTRAMSHTLSASGVYMGAQLNASGDLVPAESLYEACRVLARHVRHLGGLRWDFDSLHTMPIDPAWTRLVEAYLASVLGSTAPRKGWKLPETILVYPWIVRKFPEIRYLFWIRDPRDCILSNHLTDDLADFGVSYDRTDNLRARRAISWKYQAEIYRATPRPRHVLEVRFEDLILRQDETVARFEAYLDCPIAKIPVRPASVGRWRRDPGPFDFPCFRDDLARYGYEPTPEPAAAAVAAAPGQEPRP